MKTTDKIVLSVANDLDARSIVGIDKYGTTLDRNDLSLKDWLIHAYEETLDKALYLKRAIIEIEQSESHDNLSEDSNIVSVEIEDSDIATIEALHDLLLDAHGYSLDFITLKKARELTAKMYKAFKNNRPKTLEEKCKAILNTLEEPYRTEALKNFDSEYFEGASIPFDGTKSKALLLSFRWRKSNLRIGEYYEKLKSQGE